MMVAEKKESFMGQMYMFPVATNREIQESKKQLGQYKKMKKIVEDYEKPNNNPFTAQQINTYRYCKKMTNNIERAANLIINESVREIIEHRYLKGNPRNITVQLFEHKYTSDRTVDRKLAEGIESIANSLKLWES